METDIECIAALQQELGKVHDGLKGAEKLFEAQLHVKRACTWYVMESRRG